MSTLSRYLAEAISLVLPEKMVFLGGPCQVDKIAAARQKQPDNSGQSTLAKNLLVSCTSSGPIPRSLLAALFVNILSSGSRAPALTSKAPKFNGRPPGLPFLGLLNELQQDLRSELGKGVVLPVCPTPLIQPRRELNTYVRKK